MTINELNKRLEESIEVFRSEANMRPLNHDMMETLNGYDYDELCRQTFYVFCDFKENIIKYLRELEK